MFCRFLRESPRFLGLRSELFATLRGLKNKTVDLDTARAKSIVGDAAEVVAHAPFHDTVDALQVDLYDHEAAAPVLDSFEFYRDCRAALSEQGCMTVNLFGSRNQYPDSVEEIAAAFGRDAVWLFKPTKEGNTVVLAQATSSRPTRAELEDRAAEIQTRWGLPAPKWVRVFKPVEA